VLNVTVNITGTVVGAPVDGVMVIMPWYVPLASPAVLADTVSVAGVCVVDGET
jgi:hypothetical protein